MKLLKAIKKPSGFTLVEVMVVIIIFGILTTAVAVNWNSFMRHQEIRKEAGNMHKDILAMKALALEHDTAVVFKPTGAFDGYTIVIKEETGDVERRNVSLHSNISITAAGDAKPCSGLNNIWSDSITVIPNNLNAFGENNQSGWLVITSSRSNTQFCIVKDSGSIKPELHTRKGTGAWKKI